MGVLTRDPNVLMKRWMETYMNLNILMSTDPETMKILSEMKNRLAEANEYVMRFFDKVEAYPEGGF